MQDVNKEQSISGLSDRIAKELEELASIETYANALARLSTNATNLNTIFTQNRSRIEEMHTAIADAIPGIERLGGSVENVAQTIGDIALASKRNVISNRETVEELYATTKVLGQSTQDLVNSFTDVGIAAENITDTLETSIHYVQSIGGNAKQVMSDVVYNADKLNRFQFENGVQGLTKMAAQASMMRFDMSNTFQLAEKVLSPESAVEVAAAFQRLGVAAGNLVDPFQLMNQSINDPSGLQDSLINMSKQFTYFDEQTKSFKISPEGVLRLKEIGQETGISANELMKAGLAASELDARLSSIKPDIKFAKEEDKQYLANIASMEGGEYVVSLRDERGTEYKKRLEDVTQEEMTKLIDEQKRAQKPMEEVARDQLTVTEMFANDIRAIKDKLLYGIVSSGPAVAFGEGVRGVVGSTTGALSQPVTPFGGGKEDLAAIRDQTSRFYRSLEDAIKGASEGDLAESLDKFLTESEDQFKGIETNFTDGMKKFIEESSQQMSEKTLGERLLKKALTELTGEIKDSETKAGVAGQPLGKSLIEGERSLTNQMLSATAGVTQQSSKVDFGGNVTIDLKIPAEFGKMNPRELEDMLERIFNSQEFRNNINGIIDARVTKLTGTPPK